MGRRLAKVEAKSGATLPASDGSAVGKVVVENIDGAAEGVDALEVGIDSEVPKHIEF